MRFMLLAGMSLLIVLLVFGCLGQSTEQKNPPTSNSEKQEIYIKALANGDYDNKEIVVKKGIPVRVHFTANPGAGCGRQLVIYGTNVNLISQNGEEKTAEFTPQKEGTYEFSCGMRMQGPGRLVVQ